MAQRVVTGQPHHVVSKGLHVAGLKNKPILPMVDQLLHAAHVRGDDGAMFFDTFQNGIGEGFGDRTQHIDVAGLEKLADVRHPATKAGLLFHAQLFCQVHQFFHIFAVATDQQLEAGFPAVGLGKGRSKVGMSFTGVSRAAMPSTTSPSS